MLVIANLPISVSDTVVCLSAPGLDKASQAHAAREWK